MPSNKFGVGDYVLCRVASQQEIALSIFRLCLFPSQDSDLTLAAVAQMLAHSDSQYAHSAC